MIEKNQEYIVDIIDNGVEGEGIAKIDGFTIFVPNAIKGEKVRILIVKVNKNFGYGKILEILSISNKRNTKVDCTTYKQCGGCNLRHINYKDTLLIKNDVVKNTLKKALGRELPVEDIIGMEQPMYYRNKLQYPVGLINGETVMGVYANRTHRIIPTEVCFIQDKRSQEIARDVLEFIKHNNILPYNEETQTGVVRHIIVKVAKNTNEVMIVLVVNDEVTIDDEFVKWICSKHEITTIVKNINKENTNVILGKENVVLYGNGYIQDILGNYKFNISALSFYQVNPIQTEKLYKKAIELAKLNGDEVAFDLYCGIGTISIFLADHVKKVYGIEIVDDAVINAKQNAVLNKISNVDFIAGTVEDILPEILKKDIPDIVFVDPPRKGLDENTIDILLNIKPKKVIYISCNPATLARDLKLLEQMYDIRDIQPVDMFPFTSHVETISLLTIKK